ncbi:spermidine/putrescine ABC transporter, spermidine/putrescine-binding protein precursor [Aeropyrum pernix]|uniref:Spermidine/putrescine ABC transporter, spermidine/putrescine-binding protein n=1 Tax=Aeropyrum pernix TaxID=56636 RepID=A0A401H946_AERPX|nr:spermidine/putrescine ABC transporter substrate-binding protein [Aeropyrum pernix]GBF08975.1 spermidine/putrescine ABC transporter, spermidine/putrescine-binding protein precursor [Aeropyrum pernix]
MKRAILAGVAVGLVIVAVLAPLVAAVLMGAAASASDRTIKVLNYSEYIDYEVLRIFEERYGIKVVYDEYESAEEAWPYLKAGGGGYDVIIIAHSHVKLAIEQGLVRKLDKSMIPNLSNLDPRIASHPADPTQDYAVPYMWGTTGVAYVEGCVEEPPSTWREFLSKSYLEKYSGKVSLLSEFSEVVEAGMIALGLDPSKRSSWTEENIDRVVELIVELKPYLAGFYGASQYIPGLVNGELCLAQAWNGDALIAADENPEVGYVAPEDGTLFWVDYMVIPRDAHDVEAAHLFINFLLEPEIAAMNIKAVWYAPSIKKELLEPLAEGDEELREVLDNPLVYPPSNVKLIPSPVLDSEMQSLVEDARSRILASQPSNLDSTLVIVVGVVVLVVAAAFLYRLSRGRAGG